MNNKFFTIISSAVMILAGCAKDVQPVVHESETSTVTGVNRFNITVADPYSEIDTKSNKSSWEEGDIIRVYFKDGSTTLFNLVDDNALVLTYTGSDWEISHDPNNTLSSGQFIAVYCTDDSKVKGSFSDYGYMQTSSLNFVDGVGEVLSQNWTQSSDGRWTIEGEDFVSEDGVIDLSLSLKRHPAAFQIVVPGLENPSDWIMYVVSDSFNSYNGRYDYMTSALNSVSYAEGSTIPSQLSFGQYSRGVKTSDGSTFFLTNLDRTGTDSNTTLGQDMDQYSIQISRISEMSANAYVYVVERGRNSDGTYQKTLAPGMHIELPEFDGDDSDPVNWKQCTPAEYIGFIMYKTSDGKVLEPTNLELKDRFGNVLPYQNHYGKIKGMSDEPVGYIMVEGQAATFDISYEQETKGVSTLTEFLGGYGMNAQLQSAERIFKNCDLLTSVTFPNASSLTSTEQAFYGCESLKTVSGYIGMMANKFVSMREMFSGCYSLTEIPRLNIGLYEPDSPIVFTDMSGLFKDCRSLTSYSFGNTFYTDAVTDMSSLFEGCTSLRTVDMSYLVTDKVESMKNMFKGCSSITNLDFVFFNTENVDDMSGMFESCSSLAALDLSPFTISGNTVMTDMFKNTSSLKSIRLGEKVTTDISEDIFSGIASNGVLSYPCDSDFSAWVSNSTGLGKYGWTADAMESVGGHVMVDLGLSVKWASTNLGASSPYEVGSYYAWGETSPKSVYDVRTYTFTDDVDVLPLSADAAAVNWGEGWRMPTYEEASELVNNCDWTEISVMNMLRNVSCWKVTGRGAYSANSIYIMCGGYMNGSYNELKGNGLLLTSSYDHDDLAYLIYMYSHFGAGVGRDTKPWGYNIRPVHE